ncbi:MAG: UDP-2,4-diacetamido-2,4,6-trideoxy-beta-L-altropyranose hydrolase [Pseudomonadota bacterium]
MSGELIAFRADASPRIGGGHVMRCLTLADELRAGGARTLFLCRPGPGDLVDAIAARGHEVRPLAPADPGVAPEPGDPPHAAWGGAPWRRDAEETAAAIGAAGAAWLVVDHYAFDARHAAAARAAARRIMAIDDLDDRPLGADLLLDQSRLPRMGPRRHEAPRALIGPRHALLRPDFADWRGAALARRATPDAPPRILISTGLMDVGGAAAAAAAALAELDVALEIAVGAAAPSAAALERLAADAPNIALRLDARNMAELMARADLAVGAVGASTWERFCLGLPSVVFILADNQRAIAEALQADGLARVLGRPEACGPEPLRRAVGALLADPAALAEQSRRGAALCDGAGAARAAAAMREVGA